MSTVDTIAAISTAPGRAGIGVVRISGPHALQIGKTITGKRPEQGRYYFTSFRRANDELIDRGIVLFFIAPHSYTGEDVVELQAHGSDVVLRQLLAEACHYGARPARAGEFTERAFLNDKLDLLQAEAVIDLIESTSNKAARSAVRSLEGVFSGQVNQIQQHLVSAKALLEAALDFPDEEDIEIDINPVRKSLETALLMIKELSVNAEAGAALGKGAHVVIVGKPNAGKSSLLNYLAGNDVAIVSDIPGTTRDRIKQSVLLDGVELVLIDTAGIRESNDEIEMQGICITRESLRTADLVLCVADKDSDFEELAEALPVSVPHILVRNKIDILIPNREKLPVNAISISVKNQAGMEVLVKEMKSKLNLDLSNENTVSARQRHLLALQSALIHIEDGLTGIDNGVGYEIVGENIRQTLLTFDEMLGKVTADDILGKIFSQFCIGK